MGMKGTRDDVVAYRKQFLDKLDSRCVYVQNTS